MTVRDGELGWLERRPRREVEGYFERQDVELVDGQIAEANLAAEGHHHDLLETVDEDGVCLVLDYGYEAQRLYDPRGRRGGPAAPHQVSQAGSRLTC